MEAGPRESSGTAEDMTRPKRSGLAGAHAAGKAARQAAGREPGGFEPEPAAAAEDAGGGEAVEPGEPGESVEPGEPGESVEPGEAVAAAEAPEATGPAGLSALPSGAAQAAGERSAGVTATPAPTRSAEPDPEPESGHTVPPQAQGPAGYPVEPVEPAGPAPLPGAYPRPAGAAGRTAPGAPGQTLDAARQAESYGELRPPRRLRPTLFAPIVLLSLLGSLMFAFPLAFAFDEAGAVVAMLGLLIGCSAAGWGMMAARRVGYTWPGLPPRGSGRRPDWRLLLLYGLGLAVLGALAVWRVAALR